MDSVFDNKKISVKKRSFKKAGFIALVLLIVGCVAFVFIAGITYSEGTRSGILTKVSKRGYIFKTYEGEISIGGLSDGDGTMMTVSIFNFSVDDPRVYYKLEELQGRKVVVHYKEVIRNLFWQGETNYFVQKVELAKNL